MPLVIGFAEVTIGLILGLAGISGASLGDVIRGDISVHPSSSGSAAGASGVAMSTSAVPIDDNGVTPTIFAKRLLQSIGAPLTAKNIASIVEWEAREGGNWDNTARYNPLNTTESLPGSTKTGTQGNIGSYQSWQQGLQATVDTLENGDYDDILQALKSGNGLSGSYYSGLATWSSGSYGSV